MDIAELDSSVGFFLVVKMTLILLSLTLGLVFLSFQMTKAHKKRVKK